jgi:hypothetical protein
LWDKALLHTSSRTSAFDRNLQADKPLSANELDIIRRLYAGENPDEGYDPYEPTVEWFTGKGKEEIMPLSAAPEPKRRFVPSKWEKQKVFSLLVGYINVLICCQGHENSARNQARPHPPKQTKITGERATVLSSLGHTGF